MARNQRKEEILKSELPPALPLMALRSTIVYPLGTIAVQMGAPENVRLIELGPGRADRHRRRCNDWRGLDDQQERPAGQTHSSAGEAIHR